MEVQRGDGQYQSIGFDSNGDLDTAAIKAFCDADTGGTPTVGTVKTWYDQSGSGNHAAQSDTARQPKIYDGTAVVTENGRPTVDFDGTDDFLDSALTVSTTHIACNSVQKWNSVAGTQLSTAISEGGSQQLYLMFNNSANNWTLYYKGSTQNVTADTNQNLLGFYSSGSSAQYYKNGATLGSAFTAGALTSQGYNVRIGGSIYSVGGYDTDVHYQELIIWESDQATNRTAIESNINAYYGIYDDPNWIGAVTWGDYPDAGAYELYPDLFLKAGFGNVYINLYN
jgi:hypothetical protein